MSPRSSWQPSSKSENSVCRTFQYFPNVSARVCLLHTDTTKRTQTSVPVYVYYTQILQKTCEKQRRQHLPIWYQSFYFLFTTYSYCRERGLLRKTTPSNTSVAPHLFRAEPPVCVFVCVCVCAFQTPPPHRPPSPPLQPHLPPSPLLHTLQHHLASFATLDDELRSGEALYG